MHLPSSVNNEGEKRLLKNLDFYCMLSPYSVIARPVKCRFTSLAFGRYVTGRGVFTEDFIRGHLKFYTSF